MHGRSIASVLRASLPPDRGSARGAG